MQHQPNHPILGNAFLQQSEACDRIETAHRRICTDLPAAETAARISKAAEIFPQVNCYQPPILWDRAEGYQVFDAAGNCWIDFSSTAVMTNTGHGHPAVREAVERHAHNGLMAQFNFASDIRIRLAERLLEITPDNCDQVYFWTVGSEAIECAFRLAREWGLAQSLEKYHVLTHSGDFHGWTLAAHQLSGTTARKPWLRGCDRAIHHISFPYDGPDAPLSDDSKWADFFNESADRLADQGIRPEHVAAIFIETMQGWGALPLPRAYVQRMRQWADEHNILLIFDEIQTGFGRTGKLFGHEHYGVRPDLLCLGKGLSSSLPVAAVVGPKEVLNILPPAGITTTHAAHPLSCAAALANLDVLEQEDLVRESARKGEIVRTELRKLKNRYPNHIIDVTGLGLLNAIHLRQLGGDAASRELARDWTWTAVKQGVMLFQTNQPTIKICPPLAIPDEALIEGIAALGDAFPL